MKMNPQQEGSIVLSLVVDEVVTTHPRRRRTVTRDLLGRLHFSGLCAIALQLAVWSTLSAAEILPLQPTNTYVTRIRNADGTHRRVFRDLLHTPSDRHLQTAQISNEGNTGFSYSATLYIGGSPFSVLLDTGSSDIWVDGTLSPSATALFSSIGTPCCQSVCCSTSFPCNQYSTTKSNCSFSLDYGSGFAYGLIGVTTVSDSQTNVVSATSQAGVLTAGSQGIAGIVGLAFPSLAAFTAPVFQKMYGTFAFQLSPSISGSNLILLGSSATSMVLPSGYTWQKLQINPNVESDALLGHWNVLLSKVSVGSTIIFSAATPTYTFIDSGTSLIEIPKSHYPALMSALIPNGYQSTNCGPNTFTTVDSLTGLNNLSFSVGDVTFTLPPSAYTMQNPNVCGSKYVVMLSQGGDFNQWVLGVVFMRAYQFTLFDSTSLTISVACPAGECIPFAGEFQGSGTPRSGPTAALESLHTVLLVVLSLTFLLFTQQ